MEVKELIDAQRDRNDNILDLLIQMVLVQIDQVSKVGAEGDLVFVIPPQVKGTILRPPRYFAREMAKRLRKKRLYTRILSDVMLYVSWGSITSGERELR